MKTITRTLAFALFMMLSTAVASTEARAGSAPKATPAPTVTVPSSLELVEAIQRLQQLAEQGQAELRKVRENNESLARELAQTRRDVAQLRQELSRLNAGATGGVVDPDSSGGVPGSAATQPDLTTRIGIVEERIAVNAAQIKEQAQTKVEAESRFNVRLSGMVLSNVYYNTSDNSEAAVPVAAPPSSLRVANSGKNFGATLRQTTLGFGMTGPHVGDGRLSAHVDFDFYGGTAGTYQGEMLGVLRMRTAAARLEGSDYAVDMGLLAPMISPLSPDSLAAVYYPALGDAGNLWQWRPQFNAEKRIAGDESASTTLQGGIILPFGENFYGKTLEGKPGYQSRVAYSSQTDDGRRFEVGAGGYYYPRQFGFGRTVKSYAITGDWMIPMRGRLELTGEVYYGASVTLSEPAGSDISSRFAFNGPLDNPDTVFRGVRSRGGWAQMHFAATPRFGFNVAFGADDPRNSDYFPAQLRPTMRLRNQALSANSIYRLRSNFLFSLEYRRLWTRYPDTLSTNGHVNFAIGYAF